MSIKEIISNVMIDLERPDIESNLYSRFQGALDSAHSIDNSSNDLTSVSILVAPNLLNGALQINTKDLSKRFKSVYGIKLYESYIQSGSNIQPVESSRIPVTVPYTKTSGVMVDTDYYGFRYPNTFSSAGGILSFKGVATSAACVTLEYLGYPTYIKNPVSGEPTTDSWILQEMPDLIRAYLTYHAVNLTANDSLRAPAQVELQRLRQEFISRYYETFILETEHGIYS